MTKINLKNTIFIIFFILITAVVIWGVIKLGNTVDGNQDQPIKNINHSLNFYWQILINELI